MTTLTWYIPLLNYIKNYTIYFVERRISDYNNSDIVELFLKYVTLCYVKAIVDPFGTNVYRFELTFSTSL